jgi:hypothetical protein
MAGPRIFQMERFGPGILMVVNEQAHDNSEYILFNTCRIVVPGYDQAFTDAEASDYACIAGLWSVRMKQMPQTHAIEVVAICYGSLTECDLIVHNFKPAHVEELAQYCCATQDPPLPTVRSSANTEI